MSWNRNTSYGMFEAERAYQGAFSAGKVIVVVKEASKNWDRLTQIFSLDNDGTDRVFGSIQAAVSECVLHAATSSGNVIVVDSGSYDESVVIPEGVGPLTIVGYGPRGSAFIEPQTAGAEGMLVNSDDVTLINLGVAGESTATYALRLGDEVSRFRAHACKFEGPDGVVVSIVGSSDNLFEDCEFAWGGTGVLFAGGVSDFPTQNFFQNCRFHNLTTVHLSSVGGQVNNLELRDNVHDNAEDNTAPTDYLLLTGGSSTGIVTGSRFATATNATGVLTIDAGIMWVVNATEAGWSTARPS